MAGPVNSPVWQGLSVIAKRDGVSVAAVSKAVKKLTEKHGLEVRRKPSGSVAAVNVVQYDMLRGTFGDSVKRQAPASPPQAEAPPADTLDGARIEKLLLDAEHSRLKLAESRGLLVRKDLMANAVSRLGDEIGRAIDLLQYADPLAAAASRGLPALRIELKRITSVMATAIADHCARVALTSPAVDEPLTDIEQSA